MTRRVLSRLLLAPALLLARAVAQAHDRDDDGHGRYRGRSLSGRDDAVERVIYDLESIVSVSYVDGHERAHFERAIRDLRRFQQRWYEGRFDEGRLDRAMESMTHLVRARQIRPRDRELLWRDLSELRRFRVGRDSGRRRPY